MPTLSRSGKEIQGHWAGALGGIPEITGPQGSGGYGYVDGNYSSQKMNLCRKWDEEGTIISCPGLLALPQVSVSSVGPPSRVSSSHCPPQRKGVTQMCPIGQEEEHFP